MHPVRANLSIASILDELELSSGEKKPRKYTESRQSVET